MRTSPLWVRDINSMALLLFALLLAAPHIATSSEARAPTLWDLFAPKPPRATPQTMEELIDHISYGDESTASLQKRFGERITKSPEALRRMGDRAAREGNAAKAMEMYERSVALEPGKNNLTALANLYLSRGDEEGWLKTMERRLDLPFDRLNDANTNHDIADHFIDTGEWEKALPYAEAAATRGYWWAYNQAAWLNAALGHTQRGLELMEQNASHNLNEAIATYIMTFGTPPSEWSNELLDFYYARHSQGNAVNRALCMTIALVREDYDDAVSLMEWALRKTNDPWYGLHAALLCEERGWMDRRDRILRDIVERWPLFPNPNQNRRNAKTFVDLYIQANQSEELPHDLKARLQQLFETCGRKKIDFNGAYVGELCRLKGEAEMARAMYKEIITVKRRNLISDYVAGRGLRLLGEDPGKILRERRAQLLEENPKAAASIGVTP